MADDVIVLSIKKLHDFATLSEMWNIFFCYTFKTIIQNSVTNKKSGGQDHFVNICSVLMFTKWLPYTYLFCYLKGVVPMIFLLLKIISIIV